MTVINFFNFRCEIFFLCFCCSSSAKKIMVIRIQCTKSYFLQHPVIKILKKSSQVKKIWFEMIPFRVCVCVCVCVCETSVQHPKWTERSHSIGAEETLLMQVFRKALEIPWIIWSGKVKGWQRKLIMHFIMFEFLCELRWIFYGLNH